MVSEEGQQASADAAHSAPLSEEMRQEAHDAIEQITAAG